jgi:hypothetical protein
MMAEVSSDQDSHHGHGRASSSSSSMPMVVGGAVDTPCYCLLDGCLLLGGDNDTNDPQTVHPRVRVAITRLPAKLGRRHETTDPHFCSLGTAKALSREHVRIDYRVPKKKLNQEDGGTGGGGYLQSNDDHGGGCGFRLVPQEDDDEEDDDDDDDTSGGGLGSSKKKQIPSTGAYVITCLSKNRIMVDQERIDQDQTTILRNGAAIKIGPVCVYFLLPTEPPQPQQSKESPQSVPAEPHGKPQHRWSLDVSSAMPVAAKSMMTSTSREESMGSSKAAGSLSNAGGGGGGASNVHLQLEALSWHDLANEYHKAKTERRKQIVQSVIVARGALDAAVALCPSSTNNDDDDEDEDDDDADATTTNEYAANDIIAWLEGSEKYGPFQNEMKDRMEPKSYKASITKALLRAGFVRNNALGPRVRWHLPASILRRKRRELKMVAAAVAQQQRPGADDDDDDDAASASSSAPMEEDNDNNGIEEDDDDNDDNDQDGNDDDSMEE